MTEFNRITATAIDYSSCQVYIYMYTHIHVIYKIHSYNLHNCLHKTENRYYAYLGDKENKTEIKKLLKI